MRERQRLGVRERLRQGMKERQTGIDLRKRKRQ